MQKLYLLIAIIILPTLCFVDLAPTAGDPAAQDVSTASYQCLTHPCRTRNETFPRGGTCPDCGAELIEAGKIVNVAILLWDGVELLDFAGPGEVFSSASAADGRRFRVMTVAESHAPIVSQGFLRITPEYSIDDCPPPDILVLPGGGTRTIRDDARAMQWVMSAVEDADITLSVCTGAFLLADLQLLDGQEATTFHNAIERMRSQFPLIRVHADKRFVDNGRIITSAGVSAGIDAALYVVGRLFGMDSAQAVAAYMEYDTAIDLGRVQDQERSEAEPEQAAAEQDEPPIALNGQDPVALVHGENAEGSDRLTQVSGGWRYRFASEANLQAFQNNVDNYSLQCHGQCVRMPDVRARSELYTVYEGRIYGFGSAHCQQAFEDDPDKYVLDRDEKEEVLAAVAEEIRNRYVRPDLADAIAIELIEGFPEDRTESAAQFSRRLNSELLRLSEDKHLWVGFPARIDLSLNTADRAEQRESRYARENFGFRRIEILDGNIGMLEFTQFVDPDIAGETAVHAMNFLAHTDALIIDLRRNLGGSPNMVAFLSSYFVGPIPIHLNSIHWRESDQIDQWWTHAYVPGRRYLEKPVYVLTSEQTFSAAEEFAYNLKHLGRAIIVGETTAGGAHPAGRFALPEHFEISVPIGASINPITNANWEGQGVRPDAEVPADDALRVAIELAKPH